MTPTASPTVEPTQSPTIVPTDTPDLTPTVPPEARKTQDLIVTPKSLTLYIGGGAKTLKVSNAKGKVTYKNNDPKIIKIDAKGNVTPVSKGRAILIVNAAGDTNYRPASVDVYVTVIDDTVKVKKEQRMTVGHRSFTLYAGGRSKTLKVSNAKGHITYKSSKPKVVGIDTKGKMIPRSSGKATITIKSAGNDSYKAATLKVKVTVKKQKQKMTVRPRSLTLYMGSKGASLKVSKAKGKVTYKSSDPKVVKVSKKGRVTPRSSGNATITVRASGNASYKAATHRVKVRVKKKSANFIGVKGTYYDFSHGSGDPNLFSVQISNITDTDFRFTIYQGSNVIFTSNTADITGDTTGVYQRAGYRLYFKWTDAGKMNVSGFGPVEGVSFLNNAYYQVS